MEVSQPLDHITHAVIGGGKTIDFGISNSAEFFDILSRTLYTDQILAVVREVLCNAWDAHIAAGCTNLPIQITLDSDHFMVRDFGHGIRHADIGPIYGVYGASTKKNDGLQTGGFGLGCKAPFAYTDHFEVVSHHVGTKTIYNMSKSNAVAKGKPGIITLASFPTDECGLRVKMPIQGKDWTRFKEVIKRIVANGEMNAVLNGELLPTIPFSQAPHGYILTTDWVMGDSHITRPRNSGKRILLRYGNVIYPIESNEELHDLYSKVNAVVDRFEDYLLILQAPPDSISVTPSREALSMQEHTVETLKKLFKAFLANTKGLNEEILIQGKEIINSAVADKHYETLFDQGWGYKYRVAADARITDLVSMARYQLTKAYPNDVKFRLQDVDYRIRKAAEAKIVDPHLAATFLEKLPTVKALPNKYHYNDRKHSSDWLHRRVLGKVMVKLRDIGMNDSGLYVLDSLHHSSNYNENKLISARQVCSRNHLSNLPFLRKTIVITTAVTLLQERIRAYCRHNPGAQYDGTLCYHIRSRKADNIASVIALFTKLGYEIIDLTKRHTWEAPDPRPTTPRKKAEPYPGLPALSNISRNGGISIPGFREKDAVLLSTPELVMVIGARNTQSSAIEGFSTRATKALVKLYGKRLGIAKDKNEMTRAIKNGAVEFIPVLEAEMQAMLLHSSTVAEFFAYDYPRVRETTQTWVSNMTALSLIYRDLGLRKEFGLPYNLTEEEAAMMDVFHYFSGGVSDICMAAIRKYAETIPLGRENKAAVKAVTNNEMLTMLDIINVKNGLKSPKRQTYFDIFIKVLKG